VFARERLRTFPANWADGRGERNHMKILRAILNTIVDVVMLPFRAIGRLLGAGESTAKGGGKRRR